MVWCEHCTDSVLQVMKNRMIDLQVANNKLFFRCIGIVADFAQCSDHRARESLLRAIYGLDHLAAEVCRVFMGASQLLRSHSILTQRSRSTSTQP